MKRRNGNTASAIFAALCTAGIVTLCSQASLVQPGGASADSPRRGGTSFDPGARRDPVWGELVPASLERGAAVQLEPPPPGANGASQRLRLR